MQNAKDTFYVTLQSRLAVLNPARTIVVRGQVRPGVLVEENELPTAVKSVDTFRLEWSSLAVDCESSLPLVQMLCTIQYATDGNSGNGGMDRGRLLAAMDTELLTMLGTQSHSAAKQSYADAGLGIAPTTMATNIFWTDPVFGKITNTDERLERSATVEVFAYQEAGER